MSRPDSMNFLVTVQRSVKLATGHTRPNGCEVLDECGDRGYDSEPHREWPRQLGIESLLATRNTPHGSSLGVYRWADERTLAWFLQFRRLRVRYERRDDMHEAFMKLGCILICSRLL
jgi:transposase